MMKKNLKKMVCGLLAAGCMLTATIPVSANYTYFNADYYVSSGTHWITNTRTQKSDADQSAVVEAVYTNFQGTDYHSMEFYSEIASKDARTAIFVIDSYHDFGYGYYDKKVARYDWGELKLIRGYATRFQILELDGYYLP